MINIYERLGVTPIINACGPVTRLSGGVMGPEVGQAMMEASQHCVDMVELQAVFWRKQFGALTAQAEEVRALSTKVTADAAEPIKEHVTNGMDKLRKVN